MAKKFTVDDMLTTMKLTDRVYVLMEAYSWDHRFPIGVIVGDTKAFVLDSGYGLAGNIREYIEKNITDKPLVCICLHGHLDHASGAILFDERYLNERDWPTLEEGLKIERRLKMMSSFALGDPDIEEFCRNHAIDCTGVTFKNVDDGDVFEDGDLKLEVIAMPGHSKGQIAVNIPSEKYCFVSDAILKRTHFDNASREDIGAYAAVVENFINRVAADTILINGHEQSYVGGYGWPLTMDLAKDLKTACEDVYNGRVEGDAVKPEFFPGQWEQRGKTFTHVVGKASLLYSERIFK